MFSAHKNEEPKLLNAFRLKSVLEKLRFRDGLVWVVGPTVETKMLFQSSSA